MPLMAWAYMSTMMYLTSASDAFRLGGPGQPAQRANLIASLKGTSLGSFSQSACFSQNGVGPMRYPSFAVMYLSYCARSINQRMNATATSWFFEYLMMARD